MAIATALLHRIVAHAQQSLGREVCGLLFGTETRIDEASPAANVSPYPRTAFEIDPRSLFAAIRAERAGGPRLIGHYHSHPNGRAMPSPRDAAQAHEPGRLWLIVARDHAACFRAEPGGPILGAFRPVMLTVHG